MSSTGRILAITPLFSVTTSELVTFGDLALLSNVDDYALVHTRAQFVFTLFCVEDLHTDDGSLLTVRNL